MTRFIVYKYDVYTGYKYYLKSGKESYETIHEGYGVEINFFGISQADTFADYESAELAIKSLGKGTYGIDKIFINL